MIIALFALLAWQEPQPNDGIPSAYQGVWDVSQAFCDAPVSDMRLGVSSKKFSIYRDMFRIHKVRRQRDGSLTLSVSYRSHDDLDNEGFAKPYALEWKLSSNEQQLTMSREGKGLTTWIRCSEKSR